MSGKKTLTLAEVKAHTTEKSCWFVIRDKVYDVTKFLDEHPGGREVLLDVAGGDATAEYDEVGHSNNADAMLKDYFVADLAEGDRGKAKGGITKSGEAGTNMAVIVVVLLIAILAAVFYNMNQE
eukprot:PhM_4_TR13009/c0_g1_i1/m.40774